MRIFIFQNRHHVNGIPEDSSLELITANCYRQAAPIIVSTVVTNVHVFMYGASCFCPTIIIWNVLDRFQ